MLLDLAKQIVLAVPEQLAFAKQIMLVVPEQLVPTKQIVLATCGDAALLFGPRPSEVWAEASATAVASELPMSMFLELASLVLVVPPALEPEVL